MRASNVSFAISAILASLGIDDASVEESTDKAKDLVYFDIQRPSIKGEEQWFCFRVTFHFDTQQSEIVTRKDFENERVESSWQINTIDEDTLRFWLHLCIDRDYSILEELTRP
jgi:hypothetical protein